MDKVHLWKDEYKIGSEPIDSQHRELFSRIEQLLAITQTSGMDESKKECCDILDFLVSYTIRHFAAEEALQKELDYVDYRQHARLHKQFQNTVLTYKKEIEENFSKGVLKNFVGTLLTWLTMHVCICDKKIILNEPMDPRNRFGNKEELIWGTMKSFLTGIYHIPVKATKACVYKGYVDGDIIVRSMIKGHKCHLFLYGFSQDLAKTLYNKLSDLHIKDMEHLDELEQSAFIEIGDIISSQLVIRLTDENHSSFQSRGCIFTERYSDPGISISDSIFMDLYTGSGNIQLMYCQV